MQIFFLVKNFSNQQNRLKKKYFTKKKKFPAVTKGTYLFLSWNIKFSKISLKQKSMGWIKKRFLFLLLLSWIFARISWSYMKDKEELIYSMVSCAPKIACYFPFSLQKILPKNKYKFCFYLYSNGMVDLMLPIHEFNSNTKQYISPI